MSESESSGSEWEGVDSETEDYNNNQAATCMFCTETISSPEAVFQHCDAQHHFNFVAFCKRNSIEAISYIKLINYIRLNKPSPAELQLQGDATWSSNVYMKPVDPEDRLLTFDIESFVDEQPTENVGSVEAEVVSLPKREYDALLQKLTATESKLQNAWDRIERMKETAKNVLYSGNNFVEKSPEDHQSELDSYYFSSYDHFGIHHEMLQDKVRTMAYRNAILGNSEVFANKRVMDLGCGTAILSMFAAKAGAAKVLAVDKSDVIYQAMDIIRENNFDKEIDLFKGRVEEAPIPESKVDIIVSEWMGYFLLFEGMLDSVLYARDKHLAAGGLILPDRCTLSIAAVSDAEKYEEYVKFWNDVYGFKMSVMKREVIKEANVESVKAHVVCSHPVVIKELDLMTCSVNDTEFATRFELLMTRDCQVTALTGFFDCMFDKGLIKKVTLSTSPLCEPTHWKQTIFLFPEPIDVKAGERIQCRLSCRKNRRDPRTLIVKIDFGSEYNQYYLA